MQAFFDVLFSLSLPHSISFLAIKREREREKENERVREFIETFFNEFLDKKMKRGDERREGMKNVWERLRGALWHNLTKKPRSYIYTQMKYEGNKRR